jgi:predicted DNA-binding transcriptional regulator AlpA
MREAKLVDIEYMATLLHKTRRTLEVDVTRRPETLPPRLIIPGSRKVLWLESDVFAWLEKCRNT